MSDTQKSTWAIDPVHTRIRFDTKYLLISTVSGWFREFEGTVVAPQNDFSNSSIEVTIYTQSLYTGIDERDNHLRSPDFFDAKKYPTIHFKSGSVTVKGEEVHITGTLAIKDASQEISFVAHYLGSVKDPQGNTKAGFEIDAVFDRKDFNITWNQYFDKQGVLVGDQVKLHCDVQLLRLS